MLRGAEKTGHLMENRNLAWGSFYTRGEIERAIVLTILIFCYAINEMGNQTVGGFYWRGKQLSFWLLWGTTILQ